MAYTGPEKTLLESGVPLIWTETTQPDPLPTNSKIVYLRNQLSNVYKYFIVQEHYEIIKQFCKKYMILLSFREAGEKSIKRIKEGYLCKGHEILEKSIKTKSINKIQPTSNITGVTTFVKSNHLNGFIGHWTEETTANTTLSLRKNSGPVYSFCIDEKKTTGL